MERVLGYIDKGSAEGAKLALGGKRVMTETGGYYIEPTVFDDVAHEMTHFPRRDLRAGAVGHRLRQRGRSHAHRQRFALRPGRGRVDQRPSRAHRVARKLRAGSVWVNYWDGGDMTAPFGGYKQSGNGRDKSLHAFSKYTEVKATWINLEP